MVYTATPKHYLSIFCSKMIEWCGIDSEMYSTSNELDGVIPNNGTGLGSGRWYIQQHQNTTCQFFVPKMIEWCGIDSEMYSTSNELDGGSQRKVHKIYFPLLEKQGEWTKGPTIEYRGCTQQVWKLNPTVFLENLNRNPRWQ